MRAGTGPTKFGRNYQDTIMKTFDWIQGADRNQFQCANGLRPLLGNTADTWSAADCTTFLEVFAQLWNDGL